MQTALPSGEPCGLEGGAVVVPGADTARQDAHDCASVKVCECVRGGGEWLFS